MNNKYIEPPSSCYHSGIRDILQELREAILVNRELGAMLADKTNPIRLSIPENSKADQERPSLSEIEESIWDCKELIQRNNSAISYIIDTLRI
jgi:hypothetical protein